MLRNSWGFALCILGLLGTSGQAQTYGYGQTVGNQTFYHGTSHGVPYSGVAQHYGNQTLYSGTGGSGYALRNGNQTLYSGISHGVPYSGTAQHVGNQTVYSGTGHGVRYNSGTGHGVPYNSGTGYGVPYRGFAQPIGGDTIRMTPVAPTFGGNRVFAPAPFRAPW